MRRSDSRPFFPDCDRIQALTCWLGVVANAALITWSAIWLCRNHDKCATDLPMLPVQIVAALFLADFFSGFVHWLTDTWFDETVAERIVSIAREHHLYPHHITRYGFRDYVAFSSWPTVVVIGPPVGGATLLAEPAPPLFGGVLMALIVSAVMFFGTYAHRLGHVRSSVGAVRALQRAGLLMSPRHHAVHHRGNHDIRYCVINGWANHVCDRLRLWRGLEHLVEWATGAVPRANDRRWFARFESDPMFLAMRRPMRVSIVLSDPSDSLTAGVKDLAVVGSERHPERSEGSPGNGVPFRERSLASLGMTAVATSGTYYDQGS